MSKRGGKAQRGRGEMYDGGDGSTLTRCQTRYKGAKNDGDGDVDK